MWPFQTKKAVPKSVDDAEHAIILAKVTQYYNDTQAHLLDLNATLQSLNSKLAMREGRATKKAENQATLDPYDNLLPGQKV